MKKATVVAGVLLAALWTAPRAAAEIIEIRGEGFVNGQIVSDDGVTVTVKTAGGEVRKVPKSDILFVQPEDSARKWRNKVEDTRVWLKDFPKHFKRWADSVTSRVLEGVHPVGRRMARSREEALAKATQ